MGQIDPFRVWWFREGSAMQQEPNETQEDFIQRITEIAWRNGEYCASRNDALEEDRRRE